MAEFGIVANAIELTLTVRRLFQKIQQTSDTIKHFPTFLRDNHQSLDLVLETLLFVENTPALRYELVVDQVNRVFERIQDVKTHLTKICQLHQKCTFKKYVRIFVHSSTHEKKLSELLWQLGAAKTDLLLRIQIAGIDITGSFREEFASAQATAMPGSRIKSGDNTGPLTPPTTPRPHVYIPQGDADQGRDNESHPSEREMAQDSGSAPEVIPLSQPNVNHDLCQALAAGITGHASFSILVRDGSKMHLGNESKTFGDKFPRHVIYGVAVEKNSVVRIGDNIGHENEGKTL